MHLQSWERMRYNPRPPEEDEFEKCLYFKGIEGGRANNRREQKPQLEVRKELETEGYGSKLDFPKKAREEMAHNVRHSERSRG